MTLAELADALDCRLDGDGTLEITGAADLAAARPGQISVLRPRALSAGRRAHAGLGGDRGRAGADDRPARSSARRGPTTPSPGRWPLLHPPARPDPGVHPLAAVPADADLAARRLDRALRAPRSRRPHRRAHDRPCARGHRRRRVDRRGLPAALARVACAKRVRLGDRVIVQNGAVIGSDGFGFTPGPAGPSPQDPAGRHRGGRGRRGDRRQHDDRSRGRRARRGSGPARRSTTSCRWRTTCTSGEHVLLAAQVGISGSTTLEDRVTLGGQVGVAGPHHDRPRRRRRGPVRRHQLGRARAVPDRLSGDREPPVAQGVGHLRAPARDAGAVERP